MSNDWRIVPASNSTLDSEPHCVVWEFNTKDDAMRFAVKAEYINEHNIDLAAASIYLDSVKAHDPARITMSAIADNVRTQLKLNRAMALLERSCNGNELLMQKVRELVDNI